MAGWNEWVPGTNMTLSEVLDALKSASVGLDVKDKLYWSFFKVVQEAIKEGNANFDVQMAKGVYNTLKDRLDAGDTDLRNISVDWINKNLGKLDQTFMSEEFLQMMAGNTPINAVPADGSLTTVKYADKSITLGKVEYIIEPANLFEVERYGASFDPETWAIISNPEYGISPPIYVNPDKEYMVHTAGTGRVVAYNKDNGAIKMTSIISADEQVVYVPNANTYYIRVQTKLENEDKTQVNKGAVLLPYSKYFTPKIDTSKVNVFGEYMAYDGEGF